MLRILLAAILVAIIACCWVVLIAGLAHGAAKTRPVPPDPRTPAVNVFWPEAADALLDESTDDLAADAQRETPNVLDCATCGHVSTGATTLEALAADTAHWRETHALRLALESAS